MKLRFVAVLALLVVLLLFVVAIFFDRFLIFYWVLCQSLFQGADFCLL